MESKEPEKKPEEGGEKGEEGGEDEMMKVKISGGKVTGSFEFDHARGLMVKRGSKTSMNVNRMGMEIPIDSEQTIELVKVGTGEEPKEEGKK
jgi:hypothetical protein